MVKRKKIIFPFFNSYFTSTAIIIYQTNMIRTLMQLPDEKKPELIIWYNKKSPLVEIKKIGYPYIRYTNTTGLRFRLKKLAALALAKTGMKNLYKFNKHIDCIYPAYQDNLLNGIKSRIYWKADFQENYYPQYFTPAELDWVKTFFIHLKENKNSTLVLSSHDAHSDLLKFYPDITNPVYIFRFVSHIGPLNDNLFPEIITKYRIIKPYYIVCNQYWPHKNHQIVLEALGHLKQEQLTLPFQFVFTGKTSSIRGSNYFTELQSIIKQKNISEDVIITDFIEREHQLLLIKNAVAVVQPTLFEGWSTVIEDAKALNKFVIASNINVNQEQLKANALFFNPKNKTELITHLCHYFENQKPDIATEYVSEIIRSVSDLKKMFNL